MAKKNAKQAVKQTAEQTQAATSAEIEKKCTEIMKKCAARVKYFDETIVKHESHIESAKQRQEKAVANAEKRCNNLRLKGDPKTKAQAQLAKLKQKAADLEEQIKGMK